jgi:DNA polymerase-3 subunit gamma/tau
VVEAAPEPEPEPAPVVEVEPEPTPVAEEVPVAAPASAGPTVETMREAWNTLRNKVGERNKVLPAMLSAATVHDVRGQVLVIAHVTPVLGARVTSPHNAAVICEVLSEMFGGTWQVEYQEGAPVVPAGSGPAAKTADAPARPAAAPRFSRPSQERAAKAPATPRPQGTDRGSDDIPPPEAPDYPDDPGPAPEVDYEATPAAATPEEEKQMFAEAAQPADPTTRRDPEEVAKELLKDVLGAGKLE